MILYHGTSGQFIKNILEEGLKPRGLTKRSNWGHTIDSNPNNVYLTTCYAGYFAINSLKKSQHKIAIIEIDTEKLDKEKFYPDEDFIAQGLFKLTPAKRIKIGIAEDIDLIELTKIIRNRIEEWKQLWKKSIEYMGTCCYRSTISIKAINKIAVFDTRTNPEITLAITDPSISIDNYQFCSGKYKVITRWLMGDKITVNEFTGLPKEIVNIDYNRQVQEILSNQKIEIIRL